MAEPEANGPPPEASPPIDSAPEQEAAKQDEAKQQKKKDKVRSAWISFAGRIVAQILGAAAAVTLGLLVFRHNSATDGKSSDPQSVRRSASANRTSIPGQVALAVLPLLNLSADPSQEYFADGLTEALITRLSHIDGLRVISRTSSMYYKGQSKPLPEIGRELGVDTIVEGSVMKDGGRARIAVQLIDAKTDEHIWARDYDRDLRDVLSMQAEVATAIAREVMVALTPLQEGRLSQSHPIDPGVYDLYLQGRQAWNLRTPTGLQDALRYFEAAAAKDPNFALAHAGLADTYVLLGTSVYGEPAASDALPRAKAAAQRAIALDDGLARAHTSLAMVRYRHDGDSAAADREFRRALELRPGYVTGHQWYAMFLAEQGCDLDASARAERAVSLDPLSPIMHMTLGAVHYYARRFDLASAAERRALELDPNFVVARLYLAWSLIAQKNAKAAIEVLGPAIGSRNPQALATLAGAYGVLGDAARAGEIRRQILSRQPVPAAALVRLHAISGEPEALFEALRRALAERSDIVTTLQTNALFDPVRSDPRFAALLSRPKLPNCR